MLENDWTWLGQPGHFIAALKCNWHLHTHVGDEEWCVSSVGEYYPRGIADVPDTLTARGINEAPTYYETMVFALDEDGEAGYDALDVDRYITRQQAQSGHEEMCRRWDVKESG